MSDIKEPPVDLIEPIDPGLSKGEYEQIRKNAHEKALNIRHMWRQKGFWLVCKSCEFPHSSWIGNKRMIAEDPEGIPIFAIDKQNIDPI